MLTVVMLILLPIYNLYIAWIMQLVTYGIIYRIIYQKCQENTSIIVSPEHGRNLESNNIKDANAFYGYDHSDSNSRRIFNLMGWTSIDSNLTIGSETNGVGDIVNITPTIIEILGFKQEVINSGFVYNNNSFFDLI